MEVGPKTVVVQGRGWSKLEVALYLDFWVIFVSFIKSKLLVYLRKISWNIYRKTFKWNIILNGELLLGQYFITVMCQLKYCCILIEIQTSQTNNVVVKHNIKYFKNKCQQPHHLNFEFDRERWHLSWWK